MTARIDDADGAPTRRQLLSCGAGLVAASSLHACGALAERPAPTLDPDRNARLDEELSVLTDQRATVAPIQESERRERRVRGGRLLATLELDAILMEGGGTLTYLTGVSWGKSERLFALALLADGSHFWLCPEFEAGRARRQIDGADGPGGEIVTWQEHEHPYRPLASALRARRVARLAIEPGLRHGFVDRLSKEFGSSGLSSSHEFVMSLRSRKDAHELALLRRANELTQLAIRTVAGTLAPGLSGADIGARMDRAHQRLGFNGPWNLSLIGAAAALPHGDPDARPLARGDVLLIDTGGSFHGYQSDNTRTWVFDAPPSGEVQAVWNAVRDAQSRAYDSLRPGMRCSAIDALARARIEQLGYGPGYRTFTHRLGHGIGVEGHEDPYFDGGSAVELEPGMTLSNEPGIYLVDQFGVRLEDIVAITEVGADHFGTWQKGPGSPD